MVLYDNNLCNLLRLVLCPNTQLLFSIFVNAPPVLDRNVNSQIIVCKIAYLVC